MMIALSIRQPWAHLIAAGLKDVENRGWSTGHRGPIAIHAAKLADRDAVIPTEQGRALIADAADRRALAFGRIIAVAELVDCHWPTKCPPGPDGCSPWALRAQWHWTLAGVRALADPVACTGRLGLWPLPDDVQAAVRAQLP